MVTAAGQRGTGRQPLSIAMVTRRKASDFGGVERVVVSLIRKLATVRPGWAVGNVSVFRASNPIDGMDGLSDVIAGLVLGWRLRNSTADVAFVHCPECLWGIRLLRRRRGGPAIVVVWHCAGPVPYLRLRRPGHPVARLLCTFRTAAERLALSAQAHVAVHANVEESLRSDYGFKGPVTVIENPLDADLLELLSRTAPSAGRTGLTALWAGQTTYRKGLDVALAAVRLARRDIPGLRLRVVGVPPGEPAEGVEWAGSLAPQAMAQAYRDADLLLFPTRYESYGLVAIEAMAAGLPVIVSDALGSQAVADGRNGIVVKGHDPADYAAALRRLADPRIRAAMSEASVRDARRFCGDSAAVGYAEIAESLAGNQ